MDWLLGTGEPSAESEEVDWAAGRAALEAAHPSAPAAERERFLRALPRIRELGFDERFCRMWDYYLCYCQGAFMERAISTVHLLAAGPDYRRL